MAELTPEMQASGIFLDASGNLTNPDGSPVNGPDPGLDYSLGGAYAIDRDSAFGYADRAYQQALASAAAMSTPAAGDTPNATPSLMQMINPAADAAAAQATPQLDYGSSGDTGWFKPEGWENLQGNPSSTGGFFTLMDAVKAGVPQYVDMAAKGGAGYGYGENPSTNNWRLLPEDYRTPNFYMLNGRIIDREYAKNYHMPYGYGQSGDQRPTSPGWGWGAPSAFSGGSGTPGIAFFPGDVSGPVYKDGAFSYKS